MPTSTERPLPLDLEGVRAAAMPNLNAFDGDTNGALPLDSLLTVPRKGDDCFAAGAGAAPVAPTAIGMVPIAPAASALARLIMDRTLPEGSDDRDGLASTTLPLSLPACAGRRGVGVSLCTVVSVAGAFGGRDFRDGVVTVGVAAGGMLTVLPPSIDGAASDGASPPLVDSEALALGASVAGDAGAFVRTRPLAGENMERRRLP